MGVTLASILEAAVLASSLSADAFAAGFAYGSKKIGIPMRSIHVINLVCGLITGLALLAGALIRRYIPAGAAAWFAFAILFVIGLSKLLDGITKEIIRRNTGIHKQIKLSLFNFRFILSLYADPEAADADASQVISSAEAAALALSLSLDGIAVGVGAALADVNGIAVFLFSLMTNAGAVMLGRRLGNSAADRLPCNISWVGGAVLIVLAVLRLG